MKDFELKEIKVDNMNALGEDDDDEEEKTDGDDFTNFNPLWLIGKYIYCFCKVFLKLSKLVNLIFWRNFMF